MYPKCLGGLGEISVVVSQSGHDVLLLELFTRLLEGDPVAHKFADDLRQLPVQISTHLRSDLVPKGRQDNTIDERAESPRVPF
jgi:hypothetical protein